MSNELIINCDCSKRLCTAGKYMERDIIVNIPDTEEVAPIPYADASENTKLYSVNFSSSHFQHIDDSSTYYYNGGIKYDAEGNIDQSYRNRFHKSLGTDFSIESGSTLSIDKADTTAKDHRYIGYFPEYDLENKTYTYQFEYFRNFQKRHKFYFASGTFINAATGKPITNGGCDTEMPCLALELNYSGGYIDYKLYRQSSGFVNDTNLFNRKKLLFEMDGENYYKHNISFSTNMGTATVTYTDSDPSEFDIEDTDGYTFDLILGYEGKQITIGGKTGTVGDIEYGEDGYYTGAIYVHYDDGTTDTFEPNGRSIEDTVEVVSLSGEFTAQMKVVLRGGSRKTVTLYDGAGETEKANVEKWVGDVIPVHFTIYQVINENGINKDIKVAQGDIYQPADVKLVFGIGEYDALSEGYEYGVRYLDIWKGNLAYYDGAYTVTPSRETQTLETAGKYLNDNITINPIPYEETENQSGGTTFRIG